MHLGRADRWDWMPLAEHRPGCRGVDARVLHVDGPRHVVELRFAPGATIDEHAHAAPIVVVCLEGAGHVDVGGEAADLAPGDKLVWPAGIPHRAWTTDREMRLLLLHFEG